MSRKRVPGRRRARRLDEVLCPDCKSKRRVREDLRRLTPDARAKILEVLRTNGNLTAAAKDARVSRQAVYQLMEADPEFAVAVEEARAEPVDIAEMKLYGNVLKGQEQAIEFMLETRGKDRGYVKRQEVDATHRNVKWVARVGEDGVIRQAEERVH